MNKIIITRPTEIINKIFSLMQTQDAKDFNKRNTGLRLQTFLTAFTVELCKLGRVTLEELTIQCQALQYGLSLSKQALHKRLKGGSKALQSLLGRALTETAKFSVGQPKTAMILEQFKAVLITDATTLSLPDKLEAFHKGHGGTNAKSAMKIQATYDVKSKDFRKIALIDNATKNDASYMDELIENIQRHELSITDLGYFKVAAFQAIDEKGAYFISKIKSNAVLYADNGERLNLTPLLESEATIDKKIVIKGNGGKVAMQARLCGIKLSPEIYAERLRKANKKAASSGNTLPKEERERLKWILIITNIPNDMLDCRAICEVYRIRWQIELVFKAWKRYFAIDQMNNIGKDYLDCIIYGKLIIITLTTALYAQIYHLMYRTTQRRVSFLRFMKNMRSVLDKFLTCWISHASETEMGMMLGFVIDASLMEKRTRETTEQTISDLDLPHEVLNMLSDFSL